MFKRSCFGQSQTSSTYFTLSVAFPNHSYYLEISIVSCQWCGNHYGPPLTDHFLSTSAHYPGRWFTNSFSVPWSLHASMASSSCSTTCSHHWPLIKWFFKCLTSTHLWKLVDCFVVPWGPLSLLVVSLMHVNGLHYWLIIRWFLPCLTSVYIFTWLDSYSV